MTDRSVGDGVFEIMSKFSVKRPYTVVVAVIIVILLGAVSFMSMSVDLLPSIDLPYVIVSTSSPGSSPEEVEENITRPIESSMATVSNISNIMSVSAENYSMVMLEFEQGTNMDSVIIDINSKLDRVKSKWDSSISAPVVTKINPNMMPVMISAVDMQGKDVLELSDYVTQTLLPEFESIEGVASVTATGLIEEELKVVFNQDKIDAINEKMLEEVDAELASAQKKLKQAQSGIDKGKAELAAQEKEQTQKLNEAETAINSGLEQIESAENQLALGMGIYTAAQKTASESLKLLETEEKELNSEKAELEAKEELTEQETLRLSTINARLAAIEQAKEPLQKGLSEATNKLDELNKNAELLNSQKQNLIAQRQQVQNGKITLAIELNNAKKQIESGESELKNGLAQFESARDEALKKASLDGVITADMISSVLTAQNFSMPAGYLSEDGKEYLVKVGDKLGSIEEMEGLLLFELGLDSVDKVYLSDVADVYIEDNSSETYAKINGNNGVLLSFQKQSDYSTSEVCEKIQKKMAELSSGDMQMDFPVLMNQGTYINIIIDSVINNLLYGAILAIIVLAIFLKNVRTTVIIAVSIPISVIFAIAMMYFTGITLNVISLSGLALGVGMLVDNSIVVIENIYRLRSMGEPIKEAAISGAKQMASAITSSTLTTICVFVPIIFTQGLTRELFMDMGLTIAYSLIASLIVALTLVPTMASKMLVTAKPPKEGGVYNKFIGTYERILRSAIKHKAVVIVLVLVMLGGSTAWTVNMGTEFIPKVDSEQMSVSIEMPDESTFEQTAEMADKVMEISMGAEGVEAVGAMISSSDSLMSSSGGVSMYLILNEDRKVSNDDIKAYITEKTKDLGCEVTVQSSTMDLSALGGSGIQISVSGRNLEKLTALAEEVKDLASGVEGTAKVENGLEDGTSELKITVDKNAAMKEGLTVAQVYMEVAQAMSSGSSSAQVSIDDKDYPVIVVDPNTATATREDIKNLKIDINSQDGSTKQIALADIAEITEQTGLQSISRENQQRRITVSVEIADGYNVGLVSRDMQDALETLEVPDGYSVKIEGESETINSSLKDLVYMILLAIVLIYLIMVAQFQSLLSPFIVMFTIPLAITGGLIALIITGMNLSVISMLGFLVLAGVVVNNGIVFVDCVNQLKKQGISQREALVQAGKMRMRPILMTAVTTVLGLTTMAIGVGSGSEMVQPLAVVAIGGLIYSTLLTLLVVPVMYDIFNRKDREKDKEAALDETN